MSASGAREGRRKGSLYIVPQIFGLEAADQVDALTWIGGLGVSGCDQAARSSRVSQCLRSS